MSSAECRFRPAIRFIVPSSPTSGHKTLKLVGLNQREHATVDLLHGDRGGLLDPNRYALAP
jgi:hypothetical protein